ncbi:hypothetical protein EW026_g1360 [Hermanssonia centrifuga]|uniref:P-loop containing nucleoside triphosphate hydrolase protein n=1 Tax=Hermanssonia centrifuga TaxID=98765 RepID=A0A4S4KRT5_9APHY|nr:hypothetical protein EW026_g1360 [Hermanssonia centrifuga]
MAPPAAVEHMTAHVLQQLTRHRSQFSPDNQPPPLFVAVQGPQGSGKTFLTSRLRETLVSDPHSLSVIVLSIDDLYLPHDQLVTLAQANPENRLLNGRGQPGTHDVQLGTRILSQLKRINEADNKDEIVEIPSFDKSLFGGEGDRVNECVTAHGPVDVIIMEGWCVGFYPLTPEEIERRWELPVQGLGGDFFGSRGFQKANVFDINMKLCTYLPWWEFFDTFIQIKPVENHPYDYIYTWRLQQEHHMKSLNGGKGMTDQQVEAFVDRYIPGYVFFGDGISEGGINENGQHQRPPWIGNGLSIQIGEDRKVLNVGNF